jgi:two-component system CheB/CheR fusion protein
LKRFFTKRGDRYEVTAEIRSLILFAQHNLNSDPPFSHIDLISCRNLLIYLGEQSNDKLIPLFHYALNLGGYLMLGPSESISSHLDLFQIIDGKHRIAQRKELPGGTAKVFEFRQGRLAEWSQRSDTTGEVTNWNELRQQVLLEDFSPKSCIVDAAGKILNASANIEKYLKLNDGDFKNDVIAMAVDGLKLGLRTALREAISTRQRISIENLSIRVQDKRQRVLLTVLPLGQVEDILEAYMIVFQDLGQPIDRDELEHAFSQHVPDADRIISQLEAELEINRKELDRTLQDMEAANEELKSSNEELLSMNEELHAANEELETSGEEILLGRKTLEQAHSDLQNLLRSTRIATIFLNNDLRICNFTPAISEIYELLNTDIGRSLDRFVPLVFNMPPWPDPKSIRAESPVEHTVIAKSGKSFIRRILPYQSHSGDVEGMVVTFHDVTELHASKAMFQSLVDASSQIVWISDTNGLVIEDSPSWRAFTGQSMHQWMEGNWIDAVHPEDREGISQKWQAAIQSGEVLNHEYRLWHHSGVWKWTQFRAVAQRNMDGTIHRWVGMNTDITERKRWEIELSDRESHLRRVIDNTLYFIGVLDLNGIMFEVNATALAAAGIVREDVIGKAFYDCFWWNYGDESVTKQLQQAIWRAKQGETVRYDVDVRMEKDSRMTIDFMLRPVRGQDGHITHLIASGVDISQRKMAEKALIEQANQLNLALESCRMGMYEWEPETDVVIWDKRHLAITGLPHTKMTGADFLRLVHPEDIEANRIAIERTIRGEGDYDTEFRIIREDGQVRWLAAHGKAVRFDDGRPLRFVGLNWDITDRKQTEMTIKLNEARLRNAASAAGFAMLHADLVQGVVTFSPETRPLIGLPEDAPLQIEFGSLPHWIHSDDACAFTNHIEESVKLKEGASISLDHRIVRTDGEVRWMRLHSKPIYSGVGEHSRPTQWIGTLLDVTQQRRFEESLKSARQLAEAANESKSLFLANMSHEIRTPMTAILGFAELLEDDELNNDSALAANAIQTIRANAAHLLSVINDILDMSKIEAGCMKVEEIEISPTKLLQEIESLLGPRAKGKGIELKFIYDTLMPERFYSDPTRLRQILLNLIGNAIKFTEIGSVTVRTSFYAMTNRIQFRIVDTGVGMTAKQLETVSTFQAFSQADTSTTRQFGGTGLGLRISNTLAQLLGGFINVESQPGQGSVFTVTIETKTTSKVAGSEVIAAPKPTSLMALDARDSNAKLTQPLAGMKILIAEDGPDNQRLISFHLRKAGADVIVAENGLLAAEMIENGENHFDLVLMDMQMPVMDGYQATQRLRKAGYTKPIVALTAHALETDRLKCLDAGCNAFATKPINRNDLVTLAEQFGQTATAGS